MFILQINTLILSSANPNHFTRAQNWCSIFPTSVMFPLKTWFKRLWIKMQ